MAQGGLNGYDADGSIVRDELAIRERQKREKRKNPLAGSCKYGFCRRETTGDDARERGEREVDRLCKDTKRRREEDEMKMNLAERNRKHDRNVSDLPPSRLTYFFPLLSEEEQEGAFITVSCMSLSACSLSAYYNDNWLSP